MSIRSTHTPSRWFFTAAALAGLTFSALAQERDRSKIPDRYKWNLADIYPSDAAWRTAKDKVASDLPQLRQYQGKLTSSASMLADALDKQYAFDKEISRLYVYASMLADQDSRDATHEGMQQQMVQLASTFSATASFIEPEILKTDKATIEKYLTSEPRLKVYTFYLRDVLRRAEHTLTDSEEKILADASPALGSASNAFNILSNADFPYPSVTLSDGRTVKVDQAAYTDLRALPNRADREKVMAAFFNSLGSFSRTFGTTMNGEVQKVLFVEKARKYQSALEAMLNGPNIPTSVYARLVDGVNKNLPAFHRYLKLRKQMMGVDQLHYYDLYAPLVVLGQSEIHARRSAETRPGSRRAARSRISGDDSTRVRQSLDRSVSELKARCRARTRTAARTTSTRTC